MASRWQLHRWFASGWHKFYGCAGFGRMIGVAVGLLTVLIIGLILIISLMIIGLILFRTGFCVIDPIRIARIGVPGGGIGGILSPVAA